MLLVTLWIRNRSPLKYSEKKRIGREILCYKAMDKSLLREREAFKKQAAAVGGIKSSLKTKKEENGSSGPPKKKSSGASKKDAGKFFKLELWAQREKI